MDILQDSTSQPILDLLGVPFLAYVLNLTEEEIASRIHGQDVRLREPGEKALGDVVRHAIMLDGEAGAYPDGNMAARMRRFGWTDLDRAQTHANLFRLATGGDLATVPDRFDDVEQALAAIAIDYFPITLLPVDPKHPLPQKPMIAQARVEALSTALEKDPLIELFQPDTIFYTSTGMGYGPLWPFRVAECALVTAEYRARMLGNTSASTYIDGVVHNLRIMRELCLTGCAEVPAVVGFWNIDVPTDIELTGPRGGRLRAARDADPHVPMAPRATMALDTVCEVGFSKGAVPPLGGPFYVGRARLAIEEKLVCLAGLLSTVQSEELALPMVAWTQVFDPFQPYVGMFASTAGHAPTVVFPASRLHAVEEWVARLDAHYDASIRVAIVRTVSAIAESRVWDDALIDFVIALENLFGGPGPKLEARISIALAWLLGDTREARRAIAEQSKQVYQARSKLVHGDELPDSGNHPQESARRLALDALAALFTTHTHLIPDRKSRGRLWKTIEG